MGLVGNEGQVPTADKRTMLQKLLMRKRYEDGNPTGEFELDPFKAGTL